MCESLFLHFVMFGIILKMRLLVSLGLRWWPELYNIAAWQGFDLSLQPLTTQATKNLEDD